MKSRALQKVLTERGIFNDALIVDSNELGQVGEGCTKLSLFELGPRVKERFLNSSQMFQGCLKCNLVKVVKILRQEQVHVRKTHQLRSILT